METLLWIAVLLFFSIYVCGMIFFAAFRTTLKNPFYSKMDAVLWPWRIKAKANSEEE